MQCEKCGAAYDSKGVCTNCGAKQPKSKGYLIGHSILCCLLTVMLTFSLIGIGVSRSLIHGTALNDAIAETNLATFPVGAFVGSENVKQTMSEYLYEHYVTDQHITVTDVETMVNQLGIEKLMEEKTTAYLALARGTSDELPNLTSDEVIALLEKNEDQIFRTLEITIEDADKASIAETLDPALNAWNAGLKDGYGSKLARSTSRFWNGIPCLVILCLLALLVLIRWCRVFYKRRSDCSGGFKSFGISMMVPALLTLIAGVACLICSASLADEYKAMITLIHGVGTPLSLCGGVSTLAGIFFIILCVLMRATKRQPSLSAAQETNIQNSSIMNEVSVEQTPRSEDLSGAYEAPILPQQPTAAPEPVPAPEPTPALPNCPSCGTPAFKVGQKFCMNCGMPFFTPEPEAIAASAEKISLEKEPVPAESTDSDAR